jgi:hypothetical protein
MNICIGQPLGIETHGAVVDSVRVALGHLVEELASCARFGDHLETRVSRINCTLGKLIYKEKHKPMVSPSLSQSVSAGAAYSN